MTPFERNLMFAKQQMQRAASKGSQRARRKALQEALRYFELAEQHGSLSQRQQKIDSDRRLNARLPRFFKEDRANVQYL